MTNRECFYDAIKVLAGSCSLGDNVIVLTAAQEFVDSSVFDDWMYHLADKPQNIILVSSMSFVSMCLKSNAERSEQELKCFIPAVTDFIQSFIKRNNS